MPQTFLLVAIALIAIVSLALFFFGGRTGQADGERAIARREHAELERFRAFVDDLKETAWDHREIDPALSTIIIDMIRTFDRQKNQGDKEIDP